MFLEQDEDGVWVAEVPILPGVYTQGASREQVLERIKDAIRPCLETEGTPTSRSLGVERVHIEA